MSNFNKSKPGDMDLRNNQGATDPSVYVNPNTRDTVVREFDALHCAGRLQSHSEIHNVQADPRAGGKSAPREQETVILRPRSKRSGMERFWAYVRWGNGGI